MKPGEIEFTKMLSFARSSAVALVNPIRPDFVGKNFPTSKSEYIYVHVKEVDNEDAILLVEYEDKTK